MGDWNPLLEGVAVVGLAARLPGANNVDEFWQNQRNGIEAITRFREDELEIPDAASLVKRPDYVRARSILQGADLFDASFFGIYPREAELMDPQHRVFLECCWEAFEDAGYDPQSCPGAVAVYAGCSTSTYFLRQLCANPAFIRDYTACYQVGNYPAMLGNALDFLATRVSYKLNLRGPAFSMAAGCSTSLLAICQAAQTLLTYQADMALAGGVSITFPQKRGYLYQEGGMVSADGHCRTFDADAQGTVFGSGSAVVLLKRLEDAVKDGDQIYAVVRGFGMNNDGSAKIGYTAPSVEGQASVIAMAHEAAGIDPRTIGYVEAHGTATPLGDPIELAALAQAFGEKTTERGFCAVGTAKTNLGHLDIAAGATGFIHAILAVKNGELPPTLHFKRPNPNFDLNNSQFYINTKLRDWKPASGPRRAGVSAFGVGGTNAHVVIEQAPERASTPAPRQSQLLVLSARSGAALDSATKNLADYLQKNPGINIADAAYTLQVGRRAFDHRRMLVCHDLQDAAAALTSKDAARLITRKIQPKKPDVCFMFPGQGSQQRSMGRSLYETESVFREHIDMCAKLFEPALGLDLRTVLYPSFDTTDKVHAQINDTLLAQPAIFATEYALARLWMSWGVQPLGMIGHSVGEFVAACLAGVFSLADATSLIAVRGKMMQQLPRGAMLSVRFRADELHGLMNDKLSLAAINSPSLCVVAGPMEAISALETELLRRDVGHKRLQTSHAFHSWMMDPIVEPFTAEVRRIRLSPPQIPYISGVTGEWITSEEATDPSYWARHFRSPVNFSTGIAKLREKENSILLEVGPGSTLATLARQHPAKSADQIVVASMTDVLQQLGEADAIQRALGLLWTGGATPDWNAVHAEEGRQRISLPTYQFERQRYWLEVSPIESADKREDAASLEVRQPQITAADVPEIANEANEPSNRNPTAADTRSRREKIQAALKDIFQDLSGMDLSGTNGATSFLELGFDSLFLTQVTQALQNTFHLKVTFRQLLDQQSSLDALAAYIDQKLPAGVFEAEAPAAPGSAKTATIGKSSNAGVMPYIARGSIEQLLRDQLQAIQQLIAQQQKSAQSAETPESPQSLEKHISENELKGYTPFKPLPKSSKETITPRQEKHIAALVELYSRRTARSKSMTQQNRQSLADPRVVSGFRTQWKEMIYQIVTVRSKGSRLWDVDGNEYIDILNGFGPIMLGHRPDFVEKAIEKQLHEGFEIGPQTPLAGEVARMICEFTGNERATFCNTGSEAVMAALRIARTVTGRQKAVLFAGDYHGMFDEVLVKGFHKGGVPQTAASAPGIPRESVANMTVLEYGTPEALEWIRNNANDLAAVLVEPVQSRHPDLQPVKFLKELRNITLQSGTCLIFDEVVTGFRVHPGGCQELFGIRADLATYGKVLAGGMPIGVLAGKSEYMDALDGGAWQFGDDSYPSAGVTFFAGTFVRHPLTMAAVKAVLEHFKKEGPALQQTLSERTARMVGRLNHLLAVNQVPTHIENFGSIFYFSFPPEYRFGSLFYFHLRAKGIHALEGFPCFLTTAHSDADIDQIVRAFDETIAEMKAGDMLPHSGVLAAEALDEARATATSAPMTEPQREIWLSAKLGDDASCAFNESFSLYLRGDLDCGALRDALNTVVERHEALRAISSEEGDALKFIPSLRLELPLTDLARLDSPARDAEFDRLVDADARLAFDLNHGPLIRAKLIRLEADRHVLLFTSHHMVCDGWSTNVILDELAQLYSASVHGQSSQLPAAIRSGEYAKAQATNESATERGNVEKYWLEQFKDVPEPLNLPTDRPRPAVKSHAGATFRSQIGLEVYRRIKQLGSKSGCTLFVTLLAGFQALLHRLTAQDHVVVGVPTAGQSLIEDGNLVGHCVNFLPLRCRFEESLTFSGLLAQMKKNLLDAYDHQTYTYGTLVRKLALLRDPSRLPLMEVQFNLEKIGSALKFDGLDVHVDPNPKSAVNFDIFFNVVESDQGLVIDCDYNTGLFDQGTISQWIGHYKNLLVSAVSAPDAAVDDLQLMTADETAALIAAWNPNRMESYASVTMHALFEQQAARTPENIAVVMSEDRMSYRELNERANQLARVLRARGVKEESLVAVCFERSIEMIVSFLAVLKAGGAYVPVDSSYPKERLSMMLEDSRPTVLLTQERLVSNLPSQSAEIICVDKDWPAIDRELKTNLDPVARPENVAYVIYTSGSTGTPKGVMVTHANVARLLKTTESWFRFKEQDVWSMFHTYSFDVSVWETWGCLLTGGRLVIVPFWITRSPQEFYDLLAKEKVTVLCQTPVAFYQLIQVEDSGIQSSLELRYVILAGEALHFTNLRSWFNRHGDVNPQVINMYGPTEATVYATFRRLVASDFQNETRSLIGVPLPDMNIYLLDSRQKPVPPGVAGEMYIGGAGVARGYLNRPELTAERFLPDPFDTPHAQKMYKSGDVARFLKHGDLDFLGRMDGQVKIHGFRIELGEIEANIAQHPDVREVAVVARQDGPGESKLVAYIALKSGKNIPSDELSDYLQAKLPAHMIPYAYVQLSSLPLNPSGKLDRSKLPAPDPVAAARTREFIAPRNSREKILADILIEVLRIERVGVTDNLFELGADSLHVFQITSRAAKSGLQITPRMLLQQRTIAGVLAEVDKAPAKVSSASPTITPVARQKYRATKDT